MQPDLPISSSPEFQKYTFVILIEELMMLSICPAGPRSSQGLKTLQQEITMVVSFRRINMSYLFCLHTHIAWYLFISFFCCSIYLFIFVVTQTSTSYSLFYINKTSIAPPTSPYIVRESVPTTKQTTSKTDLGGGRKATPGSTPKIGLNIFI